MKVYLANFFSKKDLVDTYSKELNAMGIEVTSRWFNEKVPHTVNMRDLPDEYHKETAIADIEDIEAADVLVLFTGTPQDYEEIPPEGLARGGRHFETGYAKAMGKGIILCGPRENVFHHLPNMIQKDTWEDVKSFLCES